MEAIMKQRSSSAEEDADIILSPDRLHFLVKEPKLGYFEEVRERLLLDYQNKFPDHMRRINDVLDSYKDDEGQALKEFRVHVPCLHGANIQRWLEFALARKVEIIEIIMFYMSDDCTSYTFPRLSYNTSLLLPGLNSLKQLSLFNIHADDRDVDLFLSEFVLLERLTIGQSERLKKVSILGHSTLKHLDILDCDYLESIEVIGAIELVSLMFYELPKTYILRLDNVPKLIDYATNDPYGDSLADALSSRVPPCVRDQLLHLKMTTLPSISIDKWGQVFPKLINLKHMELDVVLIGRESSSYQHFPLIEACPSLEKLDVKFWGTGGNLEEPDLLWFPNRENLNGRLKKVTFSSYLGSAGEVEFAMYVLINVQSLEEFIVEPCLEIPHEEQEIRRAAWDDLRSRVNKMKPFFVEKPEATNLHFVAKGATDLELST